NMLRASVNKAVGDDFQTANIFIRNMTTMTLIINQFSSRWVASILLIWKIITINKTITSTAVAHVLDFERNLFFFLSFSSSFTPSHMWLYILDLVCDFCRRHS